MTRVAPRRMIVAALAAALLGTAGCDDVLVFDVARDGRLLVAFDAAGRAAAVGDGSAPRHLALVDATAGTVARLTTEAAPLAWPRACGDGAVFVRGRTTLVLLGASGEVRDLRRGERPLLQPTPSPTGARLAVLEADRLGAPGTLVVLDVATGGEVRRVEDALLGFAWVGDDALLVPHATAPRDPPHASGPGEVLLLRGEAPAQVACRATLALAAWVAPRRGAGEAALVLPRSAERGAPVGLARLAAGTGEAVLAEPAAATLDLFPDVDPRGRVLFTRSVPDRPTLEGELRLATLGELSRSAVVPTRGPTTAPRWVGPDRVAYHTPDDRLVAQALDGSARLDLTDALRAAYGETP